MPIFSIGGSATRLRGFARGVTLVLPVSPATAFELLVLLIERDGDAMEQCGDDDWSVQLKLETAANLLATAMKSLVPGREARQTLERLAEDG